jgi:hypothetical protein
MSSHNQRAAIAAYRAQNPTASYTRALGAVREGWRPAAFLTRAYPGELGVATPPADWTDRSGRFPAVAALWRDRDGDGVLDQFVVFDAVTGERTAALVMPHDPGPGAAAAEEEVRATGTVPSSAAGMEKVQQIELGQPNRLLHQLNHEAALKLWQRWSDGSWRVPVRPSEFTHSVTVTTLDAAAGRVRLVITEHPGAVVLDEVAGVRFSPSKPGEPYFVALNRLLDQRGYVAEYGYFTDIAPGVQYERVRPGRLAQRHWRVRAELRLLREVTSRPGEGRPRTFGAGETVVMQRYGAAGQPVRLGGWHSNYDLEISHHLDPREVEVVEVLEDLAPMHADAVVDPAVLIELLVPHHPGAAEAVTAWAAAGLHLSLGTAGVEIRTPGPRYRLIGRIGRNYAGEPVKPYVALLRGEDSRYCNGQEIEQKSLPLDPVAVVTAAQRVDLVGWTLPADAPAAQVEATVEALLRRDFPGDLAEEIVDDDSGFPTGFDLLVSAARAVATAGPAAVSEAFAAVAADHADPATLDRLRYAPSGAGRAFADRLTQRRQIAR